MRQSGDPNAPMLAPLCWRLRATHVLHVIRTELLALLLRIEESPDDAPCKLLLGFAALAI